MTIQKIDDYGNLQGKVSHPDGEIALALVEAGLAKVQMVKTEDEYDPDFYKSLKDAQSLAQIKKLGLWKNVTADPSKQKSQTYDKSAKEFTAKVTEVHSGDSVTVVADDGTDRKIFFASVKAPSTGNQSSDAEPWGFEAREFIRKTCIGKKVKVTMEFKREIEVKSGPNAGQKKTMEFATLFSKAND